MPDKDAQIIRNTGNFDADDSVYFARQLEAIKSRTYDKQFPEFTSTKTIPVTSEIPAGAKTVTFRSFEPTGMAKIITSYSDDLPRAGAAATETTSVIRTIGDSYEYSIEDIENARMAGGIPLDAREAAASRQNHEYTANQVAYFGDAASGLPGMLTNANITEYTLSQANGKTDFASKTPAQILGDLNGMVVKMILLTKSIEIPDTLLLPPSVYAYLSSTPRSDNSDTTILAYFLMNNAYVKRCIPAPELEATCTPDGKNRAVIYRCSSDKLSQERPLPYTQAAVQFKNFSYIVPCRSKTAGTLIYYPLSVIFAKVV